MRDLKKSKYIPKDVKTVTTLYIKITNWKIWTLILLTNSIKVPKVFKPTYKRTDCS